MGEMVPEKCFFFLVRDFFSLIIPFHSDFETLDSGSTLWYKKSLKNLWYFFIWLLLPGLRAFQQLKTSQKYSFVPNLCFVEKQFVLLLKKMPCFIWICNFHVKGTLFISITTEEKSLKFSLEVMASYRVSLKNGTFPIFVLFMF